MTQHDLRRSVIFLLELWNVKSINPFQSSVVFHLAKIHVIRSVSKLTGFFMKCNTRLMWFNLMFWLLLNHYFAYLEREQAKVSGSTVFLLDVLAQIEEVSVWKLAIIQCFLPVVTILRRLLIFNPLDVTDEHFCSLIDLMISITFSRMICDIRSYPNEMQLYINF